MKARHLAVPGILALALLLAAPAAEARLGRHGAKVALSSGSSPAVSVSDDSYVPKGQVHEGDLVTVFGDARVEGTVTGQVVVIMGSLDLSGEVEGDTVSIMSDCKLADTARIGGQLVNIGGSLDQAPGSQVAGEIVNVNFMKFIPFAGRDGWAGLMRLILFVKLMLLTLVFVGILLATALVPRRLTVMAAEFPRRWGWALLVGLATYVGAAVGFSILLITIIGIPLAIALWGAVWVMKILGLASIFFLIGNTAGRNLFNRDLHPLASVLGGFAAYALLSLVPFFGLAFRSVMSLLAVGMVLLTRFGSERMVPPIMTQAAAPPPAPAAAAAQR